MNVKILLVIVCAAIPVVMTLTQRGGSGSGVPPARFDPNRRDACATTEPELDIAPWSRAEDAGVPYGVTNGWAR